MDVFVARQPIFDKKQKVFGYELLYRLGMNNIYEHTDGDKATSEVIANSFLLLGIENITGGRKAFINFTDNLLKSAVATNLPRELIAVEVLETVTPDDEILEACRNLKNRGYTIVLDDFILDNGHRALVQFADIIKVDFLNTGSYRRREIVKSLGSGNIEFLAEKVETVEHFQQAVDMGYTYFQGYFFSKPVIMAGRDVPAQKINFLSIIQETNRPEFDFNRLDNIVKRDVSLSYKLLKYINSAAFGFRSKITSIKHALVMLGIVEIKKWVTLIALRGIAADKPDEIITSCIVRARFGELLAPKIGLTENSSDLFLMGLFSMIDVLVSRPMSACLAELPISEEIKDALTAKPGKYREVFELILSYERADWENFCEKAAKLKINEKSVPEIYLNSLNWANQFLQV